MIKDFLNEIDIDDNDILKDLLIKRRILLFILIWVNEVSLLKFNEGYNVF